MTKKILALLLTLAFTIVFAACDSSKDVTSGSSSTSSAASSNASTTSSSSSESKAASSAAGSTSSKATSSDTSSSAKATGVKDGVYYGDGFSFKVPDGFSLSDDQNGSATFMNSSFITLNAEVEPNTSGKTTLTQKDIQDQMVEDSSNGTTSIDLSNFKIQDFKNIKVDGKEAITFCCVMEMMGTKINTYVAEVISGNKIICFSMISGKDASKDLTNILSTAKIG